jgi:hypothetical protein
MKMQSAMAKRSNSYRFRIFGVEGRRQFANEPLRPVSRQSAGVIRSDGSSKAGRSDLDIGSLTWSKLGDRDFLSDHEMSHGLSNQVGGMKVLAVQI